jgi:hypothetical protein
MTPSSSPANGKGPYSALPRPRADPFDEGMIRVALEDDRGKQRRIDRAAASWPILEHRHVVDLHQGTSLVNDRDRALNADIDPKMQGHGAIPASASRAAPSAVAGPPS